MPRDGSGIYTKPFPDVVEGTTIESTVHNGTVADVETDLNAPRPIVAGGTGATSAAQARDNLDAERAMQVVTNYDSHVFEAGSFSSAPGATGEPVGGYYASGVCHQLSPTAMVLEASVYNGAGAALIGKYYRVKWTTWGSWKVVGADEYVNVTGDTMTGPLVVSGAVTIDMPTASFVVNATSGNPNVQFKRAGITANYIVNNGSSFFIYSDGTVGSHGVYLPNSGDAWFAVSDARLPYKRTARDITDRLPPLDQFRLYENANGSGIPEVFAKAQEVDGLFPQLVRRGSGDPDHMPTGMSDPQAWGLSYDRMGALALAYIKQLTARIEKLSARVEALETKQP